MAVRHGYGKIAGADALVFAYDTGDTRNSYKGEPVTNLWDSMLNTQSLRTHTKHYWDGKKWTEDATYTHPGVEGPRGVYLGLVFKHVSGALSNSWSGTSYGYMLRDIVCTNGATMTMSSWIYASQDCNVDAIPAVIEGESGGESTVAGYPAQYDLNNKGTWQQTAKKATSDGNTRFIPLYPRKGGVTDGSFAGFFMWALPQVTYGDHVVQPIQPGATRSATQGLLDLTGNSTVDLTNAGFNSNAQLDFDGTNDYAITSNLPQLSNWTSEVVIEPGIYTADQKIILDVNLGIRFEINSGKFNSHFGNGSGWIYTSLPSTTTFTAGTRYHVVVTVDASVNYQAKIYVNGVLENTTSTSSGTTPNLPLYIGKYTGNGYWFTGTLPVTKIYNRALTAAEVKNNYNNYKGRFNL